MPDDLYAGIDYGMRRVALAIIQRRTSRVVLLEDLQLSEARRPDEVLALGAFVADRLAPLSPQLGMVAIESAILGASLNARTLAHLAYTAGSLMYAVADLGCPCTLTPSASWKKTAVGRGNASKTDVLSWVSKEHPYLDIVTQDQADAVGLAHHAMATETEME